MLLRPFRNQYDSHFNRLIKNEDEYIVNDLNQLKSTNLEEYIYDKNGNPITKKTTDSETSYCYDALDRLIKVKISNKVIVSFVYDGLNRRICKSIEKHDPNSFRNVKRQYFIYDYQNEIGLIQDNNIIQLRILSDTETAEIGSAVSFELSNKIYIPIYDFIGNVIALEDLNGFRYELYNYSSFGESKIYDSYGNEITNSKIDNPWQYLSKRLDEEISLIFFGRRYYDPKIGRWLTCDPLGFENCLNLYSYVLNDPLLKLDYYGLEINNESLPSLEQDVTLNYSWNKNVIANIQNNQIDTKDNIYKNDLAKTINQIEQDWSTHRKNVSDFSFNAALGYVEGHIGKEFKASDSTPGAYGRIFGRSAVKVQSKVAMYLGFVLIDNGIKGSSMGTIAVATVIGAVPGAVIIKASGGMIATGGILTLYGYKVSKNVDRLSEVKHPDGKSGNNKTSKFDTSKPDKFKNSKSKISGKEGAKDVPSWAKGEKPYTNESGKNFAKRLLDKKYGKGNYKTRTGSDYNKIKKWGDRAFE